MDTNSRDSVFEQYQYIVNGCVKRNFPLISALQLEIEDVIQELSIRLFRGIERFDNSRTCPLPKFLYHELQHEMIDISRRHKPHGVTGVPKAARPGFVYLDQPREDGTFFELPVSEDFGECELAEALEMLTTEERAVVLRKMRGEDMRGIKKPDRERLAHARETLAHHLFERKYEYA